jgi:hypothetical protein
MTSAFGRWWQCTVLADRFVEPGAQGVGQGDGRDGLAHAARANDADEAPGLQLLRQHCSSSPRPTMKCSGQGRGYAKGAVLSAMLPGSAPAPAWYVGAAMKL